MERPIFTTVDYTVFEADKSVLWELATFVVTENYCHHTGEDNSLCLNDIPKMITKVYQEESELSEISRILIVRNNAGEIIGTIRSTLWDGKTMLPMERLFGINPLDCEFSKDISKFWHIGRFAINSEGSKYPKSILKTLISTVTTPIRKEPAGCLLAEVDRKLFKNLKVLGVDAHQIAPSIHYLASETIPIYSRSSELMVKYSSGLSGTTHI